MPFIGDMMPFIGDIMPFIGDTMPFIGDMMPFIGDIMPFIGDTMPFIGDMMPFTPKRFTGGEGKFVKRKLQTCTSCGPSRLFFSTKFRSVHLIL
jgi:hypothetical protein